VTDRAAPEPAPAAAREERVAPPAVSAPATYEGAELLHLQRLIGNRAVGRMLARREAEATATPAPDWSTQAKAEATAKATRRRLRTDLIAHMQSHASQSVRNTAELFTGNPPMLTLDATTKRSDSPAQVAAAPSWVDQTLYDAFFRGVAMDNVHFHQSGMIGTLSGSVMYLRGHDSAGTEMGLDEMADTVVHEVSHFLVKQYGELPGTDTDAASFDRYADEFRAYWVEANGIGAGLSDADRAAAIRTHLVGTAGNPASGYPLLHAAYFKAGTNTFKTKVDALTGPIGFNLTNSLRLHRLWQLLNKKRPDNETVGDILLMVAGLTVDERREAKASSLIARLIARLPAEDADRVRKALDKMVGPKYVKFLAAVVGGKAEDIKAAYADLPAADRGTIAMNAGFLMNVGRLVTDAGARARLYAMTTTGDLRQYDAMGAFLDAVQAAKLIPNGALPEDVDAALKGLNERARWALFSWEREGAMKEYVDGLNPQLAYIVGERLRE
jgi:hypothetical protein